MDEDPVVHGEAASPPRIEQIDPLLAQQASVAEKTGHLVAEELLGRYLVHIRQRDPLLWFARTPSGVFGVDEEGPIPAASVA
jgi:hypothetical protein